MGTKKRAARRAPTVGRLAEASRQRCALAAGAWRLAELVTRDERLSALLAISEQLVADGASQAERDRIVGFAWDLLLPEHSMASQVAHHLVLPAVRRAANPKHVRATAHKVFG